MSNLEAAVEAMRALSAALGRLQSWLPTEASADKGATAGAWSFMEVAAALETARAAQRAANSLMYFLAAEAMDRGASPRTLDWPDGPYDQDP
ncbi:hypothetical protein GCM10023350_43010 [Nocardioides endophyticus]|uniref:Uncharacterized protein n=1 Tax=Nocardioides endophyticus TaxID=1353775 RepID=A0ABP8ZD55_9ACTN